MTYGGGDMIHNYTNSPTRNSMFLAEYQQQWISDQRRCDVVGTHERCPNPAGMELGFYHHEEDYPLTWVRICSQCLGGRAQSLVNQGKMILLRPIERERPRMVSIQRSP